MILGVHKSTNKQHALKVVYLKNPTLRESHIAVLQREGTYLQASYSSALASSFTLLWPMSPLVGAIPDPFVFAWLCTSESELRSPHHTRTERTMYQTVLSAHLL